MNYAKSIGNVMIDVHPFPDGQIAFLKGLSAGVAIGVRHPESAEDILFELTQRLPMNVETEAEFDNMVNRLIMND